MFTAPFRSRCFLAPVLAGVLVALVSQPALAVRVDAYLKTGDAVQGELHRGTDTQALWLLRRDHSASLAWSVPWTSIAWVEIDGARSGRGVAIELAPTLGAEIDITATLGAGVVRHVATTRRPLARVERIHVEAYSANWDADAETDGIELLLIALDSTGCPNPVAGSLQVELLGGRLTSRHKETYGELERWSERITPQQYDFTGVGRVRLAFRNIKPDLDSSIDPEGAVRVRFGADRQGGAYEALAPVSLRSFSPLRDRMELNRGVRMFPSELTRNLGPLRSGPRLYP